MASDLPRWRALLRDWAIRLVGTRSTRSPRLIKNRSKDPDTCRQSSSAQTRSSSSSRAHASSAPNPARPTWTVRSPSSSPVVALTPAIVCERLCVSAPSTIMTLVLLCDCRWTAGGHGLLRALPRSYQVTPDIPDRRRAKKQKEVRPAGRQPQRKSARRRSGPSSQRRTSPTPRITTASLVAVRRLGLARRRVRSGERLVGEGEVEVPDPVALADLEAAPRVVQRRLGAIDDCVDARDLPLAARVVHRLADVLPEEPRGVRAVHHEV